jgi:hypothetical protein
MGPTRASLKQQRRVLSGRLMLKYHSRSYYSPQLTGARFGREAEPPQPACLPSPYREVVVTVRHDVTTPGDVSGSQNRQPIVPSGRDCPTRQAVKITVGGEPSGFTAWVVQIGFLVVGP